MHHDHGELPQSLATKNVVLTLPPRNSSNDSEYLWLKTKKVRVCWLLITNHILSILYSYLVIFLSMFISKLIMNRDSPKLFICMFIYIYIIFFKYHTTIVNPKLIVIFCSFRSNLLLPAWHPEVSPNDSASMLRRESCLVSIGQSHISTRHLEF